jgi:4-hydroxy 2-oxovalerate aldolase
MNIIDVTIRESVYMKRGMNEEKALAYLREYVNLMPFKEVRDVEICFLDNHKQGIFLYNEDYIKECYNIVKGKFGLIAVLHPDLVDLDNWNPEIIKLFRTVRFMINKPVDAHTEEIIEYLHALGIEVSLNIIYITRKEETFVLDYLKIAEKHNAERFCFADSCGGCTPALVRKWVDFLRMHNKTIALNFHFHDHMRLALANATVCFDDVDIIDASVYGLGKGGGNLNLEAVVNAERKTKGKGVTTNEVVCYAKLLKFLMKDILEEDWNDALEDYKNMLIGIFDCNLKEIAAIEEQAGDDIIKQVELISTKKS